MSIARRPVGRTGLTLPELGIGTAPLGNLYREVPEADARATLAAAFDAGMSYADTAPYYGFGLAETRLGEALAGRADVVVSTKVGRLLEPLGGDLPAERNGFVRGLPFAPVYDYSHDGVLRSHEASLKRLGRDRVDLLFVHDIGATVHGAAHPAMLDQLLGGGGFRALERLRDEGAIDGFGIGVNEIAICLELMDRAAMDVILLAGRYTLLEQEALDTLFPRCAAESVSIVIGGPYNSGILAGAGAEAAYNYAPAPPDITARARRLDAVCAAHGVPLGAAALRFVLAHPVVASVIPGLASPSQVEDSVSRYHTSIPPALWDDLKAEGLLRADAPVPAAEVTA